MFIFRITFLEIDNTFGLKCLHGGTPYDSKLYHLYNLELHYIQIELSNGVSKQTLYQLSYIQEHMDYLFLQSLHKSVIAKNICI